MTPFIIRPAILSGLLALAACATPQEQCIANASKNLRVVEGLIQTTRGNLARGFALEKRQVLVNQEQVIGVDEDGDDIVIDTAVAEDTLVPVAIDLAGEQAKLDSLLARQGELVRQRNAAVQQCIALHPE